MSSSLILQGATQSKDPSKDLWQTPDYLWDLIDQFFPLGYFDPCPSDPEMDALVNCPWGSRAYINPPFSQYLKWATYGIDTQLNTEQLWICHHNHDTKWFAKLMERATMICALKNRVHFVDPITGLPAKQTAIGKCQSLIYVPRATADTSPMSRMFRDLHRRERENAFTRTFEQHGRIWRT